MADSVTVTVTVGGPVAAPRGVPQGKPPLTSVPGAPTGQPGTQVPTPLQHSSLPFTGLPVVELTLAAAALLVAGIRLIRLSRPPLGG